MRVGFMGLGIMGAAMSANLLEAGYELMVYNRTAERAEPLREKGAAVAGSPVELAGQCDVIIIMVTGPEAIEELLWGEHGAAEALVPGKTVINMSSVSPSYTRFLDETISPSGAVFLDCPVSGSKKPAEEGSLVILAGGPEDAVRELEPVLLSMGRKVVYCGQSGMGSAMKMTVNILLGTMIEGLAESLAFGERAGLDASLILETVLAGPMACGLFQLKEPMFRANDFPPQFPLKHMFKDLRFILETAYENGAEVPSVHGTVQTFSRAMAQGLEDEDFAAVIKALP
jgi:3-hydroxyisobutyrate dehydrogenase-like beta-hydroxyacid dehydrogenase